MITRYCIDEKSEEEAKTFQDDRRQPGKKDTRVILKAGMLRCRRRRHCWNQFGDTSLLEKTITK